MRAVSVISTSARHVAFVAAEGALVAAIAMALVFAGAVATGGTPVGADQVAARTRTVAPSSTISLNQDPSALHLGSSVTFTTTVSGLAGGEYPMIVVECAQGGTDVYVQLDSPNATFVLGNGSSQWWVVGGAANCGATLFAYGGKSKGFDTIRTLAGPVVFAAAG